MKFWAFDTETTGIDVFNDRIVTFFGGLWNGTEFEHRTEYLIYPGVDIPEGASNVHGISTEKARDEGIDPWLGVAAIAEDLEAHSDVPWVVMNANYDISLIQSELHRYRMAPLDLDGVKIYDPLVIDRKKDKYRKGSRKLVNLAEHYGVEVDESKAHDAAYDCLLSVQVTERILDKYGDVTNEEQAAWYAEWAEGFEKYLRSQGKNETIGREWPVRTRGTT